MVVALSIAVRAGRVQADGMDEPSSTGLVRIDANPAHIINSFDPDSALGSSIDVLSRMDIDKVFTPHIIQEVQHRSGVHRMFSSSTNIKDDAGNVLVTSYTVLRPDGNWSVMLVNRDENSAHSLKITFVDANTHEASFSGPITFVTFGSEQYVWVNDGPNSHPDPANAPIATTIPATFNTVFALPKASISVLRGKVAGLATAERP